MDEPVKVQLPTSLAGQLMDDDEQENELEGLAVQRRDRRAKTEPSKGSIEPLKIETSGQGAAARTDQDLPPGELPSVGSELHGTGTCKPCAWFWKANGCQNGKECRHCHMCPEGEIKARRKAKSTMMSIGLASPKGKLTSVAAQRCWGMEGPVTVELKPPAGTQNQSSPRDSGCNDVAAAAAGSVATSQVAAAAAAAAAAGGKGRRRIGSVVGLADKDAIIGLPAQMKGQAQPAKAEADISTSLRFERAASSTEPVKLAWGAGSDISQQSQPPSRSTRSPRSLSPQEVAAPAPAPPPGLHPVQPMLPRQACVHPQAVVPPSAPGLALPPSAPGLQPNAGLPHNAVLPPTSAIAAAHMTLGAGILRRDARLKTEPVKVLWNENLDAFQPYETEGTAAKEGVQQPPPHMLPLKRKPLDLSSLLDDLSPASYKSLGEASLGAASNDGGLTAAERASALLKATAASSAAVPPPGLQVPVGMASHGSVLHGTGQCKPCAWFWKPKGCNNGKECRHCHACPEDEIKNRKKARATMMRLGLSSPKSGGTGGVAPVIGEVDEQDAAQPTTAAMPSVMTAAPAPEAAGLVENDGLVMASGSCGNLGLQIDQESTCVSGSEHELTNSSSEEEALLVPPTAA